MFAVLVLLPTCATEFERDPIKLQLDLTYRRDNNVFVHDRFPLVAPNGL